MNLAVPLWLLEGDLVSFLDLRLRVHRIGMSHWRAGARLRSWSVVPLHRVGDTLQLPCADNEALWLGAWLDDESSSATVRLEDTNAPLQNTIDLPAAFQITGLHDQDGCERPLGRPAKLARRDLILQLLCSRSDTTIRLALCTPSDWERLAGRPAPGALTGPPPLPPRLG